MPEQEQIPQLMAPHESILHVFFHLLWQKVGMSRHHTHTLMDVRIPHTVVLNHSRPLAWYFTAKDGTIKMKSRKNLSSVQVIEELSKKKKLAQTSYGANLMSPDPSEQDGITSRTIPRAVIPQQLTDELWSGTLQEFVEPKSMGTAIPNHMIVINWTPNVVYVERRTNRLDMKESAMLRQDDATRTTLSEASHYVSTTPVVAGRTTIEVEKLCASIAVHIRQLHQVTVSNMVLHVRLDAEERPWILYCSTLSLSSLEHPLEHYSLTVIPIRMGEKPSSSQQRLVENGSTVSDSSPEKEDSPLRQETTGLIIHKDKPTPRPRAATPNMKAKRALAEAGGSDCALCERKDISPKDCTVVAQQHVLFPLEIVSFFSAHPPGTLFKEDLGLASREVPPHVLLLHPGLRFEEYAEGVADKRTWDGEPVTLCTGCATGLQSITSRIQISDDGGIRVPRTAVRFGEDTEPKRVPVRMPPRQVVRSPSPASSRPATRPTGVELAYQRSKTGAPLRAQSANTLGVAKGKPRPTRSTDNSGPAPDLPPLAERPSTQVQRFRGYHRPY